MPQMSPLWWLTLMLTFNLMLVISSSMLYFNPENKTIKKKKLIKNEMMWAW
uniref:ATP synthase F0 subunit 8 n=1 Tax=Anchon yunnanense TaxID=2885775 RepID=UPI001EE01CFA|nr:ATP synthase F0 subunit 8 [Anchon yunnanense]UKB86899.1 ATP synthase F0 subunit 8 [Anchon yunnanense]